MGEQTIRERRTTVLYIFELYFPHPLLLQPHMQCDLTRYHNMLKDIPNFCVRILLVLDQRKCTTKKSVIFLWCSKISLLYCNPVSYNKIYFNIFSDNHKYIKFIRLIRPEKSIPNKRFKKILWFKKIIKKFSDILL